MIFSQNLIYMFVKIIPTFVLLSIVLIVSVSHSQNSDSLNSKTVTKMYGFVTGEENKPINGANLVIENSIDGATTDSAGYFEFTTSQTGRHSLLVTAIQYKDKSIDIEITPGKEIEISIKLGKSEVITEEILVTASSFTSGQSSQVTLTPLEIARIPGSDADLYRAITTFPGSNQVDEGSRITVRGGDANEVLTVLDQATLYNPFVFDDDFNSSSFSTINPWGLKGINFSSGGFSARFGNALSAVLDLKSYDMPQGTGMFAFLGLANAALSGVYLSDNKKFGATFDGSLTFVKAFFKLNNDNTDYSPVPGANGVGGTLSYKLGKSSYLKLYGDYSGDELGIRNSSPTYDGYFYSKSKTYFTNLKYSVPLSGKTFLDAGVSYSRHDRNQNYGILNNKINDIYSKFRVDINHDLTKNIDLNTGAEYEYDQAKFNGSVPLLPFDLGLNAPYLNVSSNAISGRAGAYLESELRFSKKFFTVAGIRGDYHTLSKNWSVDPRFSLGYKFAKDNVVRVAIGIYHQFPDLQYYAQSVSCSLKPESAVHYILGYELDKMDGLLMFRIEGYYKDYRNLVLQDTNYYLYSTGGSGFARGVDVFLKSKITNKYSVWVSYSYTDSKRKQFDATVQTSGDYDITHSLAVVGTYDLTESLNFGFTYRISTGKPYTPVNGSYYDSTYNEFIPFYALKNSDRLPTYHRLDINLQYIFSLFGRFAFGLISVSNILNNDNLYGYTYNYNYSQKVPIKSTSRRMLYLALGIQI